MTNGDEGSVDAPGAVPPEASSTQRATTGVPSADTALQRLGDLATAPLSEHVAIFDDVHHHLGEALAEFDDDPPTGL